MKETVAQRQNRNRTEKSREVLQRNLELLRKMGMFYDPKEGWNRTFHTNAELDEFFKSIPQTIQYKR